MNEERPSSYIKNYTNTNAEKQDVFPVHLYFGRVRPAFIRVNDRYTRIAPQITNFKNATEKRAHYNIMPIYKACANC